MDLRNIPSFDADLLNNIGQKKLTLFAIGFFLIAAISWNAFLYLGYEGGWNLFARALNNGASIHDDLHYLLPNFYPEFFRFSLNIFGNDIAMKIISILLFFLIPLLSYLVLKKETKNFSNQQIIYISLLIPFICIMFKPLRVEDYHSISIIGFLLTAFLISFRRIGINVLSFIPISLVLMNRIHDGAFLMIASFLVVFLRHGGIKSIIWGIFILIFSINILNYFDPQYIRNGILSVSASSKGVGYSSLLVIPLNIFFNFLEYARSLKALMFISLICSLFYLLVSYEKKSKLINNFFWLVIFSIFTLLSIFPSHLLILIFSLSFFLLWKDRLFLNNRNYCLYLIIFSAYFFSSNLSSGGSFIELFPQAALFLIPLLIFIDSKKVYSGIAKKFFYPLYFCVLLSLVISFVYKPFGWHNYSSPKFMSRFEFQNGRLLDRKAAIISEKVCPVIKGKSTFSTPFSFYLFHCDAIPWNNAFTTFYDISDSKWIENLTNEIVANPPRYIVYSRQVNLMNVHSDLFNKGRKISNFKLDNVIVDNLKKGKWKILYGFSMNGYELFNSSELHTPDDILDFLKLSLNDNVVILVDTSIN